MNIWTIFLRWRGWKVNVTVPRRDKCVICVAPHTSNWDFIYGLAAYRSLGRKANFLIKSFWFFWPMKYLMASLGGIPVRRRRRGGESLTAQIINDFKQRDYMNLAVTPEGTRSRTSEWHTGFLRIAHGAGVPVQLGVIDYQLKEVTITREFTATGDTEADMAAIKKFYSGYTYASRYPSKFTTE